MSEAVFRFHVVDTPDNVPSLATVTGEIDVTNAQAFIECVGGLSEARPVVLDMSSVGYLDSAGFAALDRLIANRTVLIVIAPGSGIYKAAVVIELPFHHDTDSALRVLAGDG